MTAVEPSPFIYLPEVAVAQVTHPLQLRGAGRGCGSAPGRPRRPRARAAGAGVAAGGVGGGGGGTERDPGEPWQRRLGRGNDNN